MHNDWTACDCTQTLDILRFRERLEMESEQTQRMSSADLIALCKERCASLQKMQAFAESELFALYICCPLCASERGCSSNISHATHKLR